jgi:hypothetical protein
MDIGAFLRDMDIGAFLGDMNIGPFLGHMDIVFASLISFISGELFK